MIAYRVDSANQLAQALASQLANFRPELQGKGAHFRFHPQLAIAMAAIEAAGAPLITVEIEATGETEAP